MEYLWYVVTLVGIYGTVAVSLVLVVGDLGILSVAHAAVFGLGAYTSALLGLRASWPFEACVVGAMVAGTVAGSVIAFLGKGLKDDRLVLATVAIQIGFFGLCQNMASVTGGSIGLAGVPGVSVFGIRVASGIGSCVAAVALLACASLGIGALRRGRFIDAVRCIRDDELFARSLGFDPVRYRATVLAVSGAVAAAAGAVYAAVLGFVDPSPFSLGASIMLIGMVAIGAGRSIRRALLGALLIMGAPEALRFVGVGAAYAGNARQIVAGVILAIAAVALFDDRARRRRVA